ncbi:MAG: invasion associated locus B family protein [Alphaproteobacteria bacterium]|nr:invasion associated locus B family protein [Alphaproteobacteria bacterium]
MNKFLSSFVLLGLLFPGISFAATQQMIGEYDDWVAYYHKDAGGIVCYMASAPKRDEGKYTKRGDIYAVVTHRPGEKSFDVVNFVAGYTFKPGSKVTVKIGKTTISRLFTSEDKAWAVSDKVDKELVNAMKKGERMIVHGVSSKGTNTKDTYSLAGFTGAYKAISSKCKKK